MMKNINSYIIEKLHLNKDINVNEKLSIVKWFDYFRENGLVVSQDIDMNYYVHFNTDDESILFRFKSEKLLGRYRSWEAVKGTLKDIPLIEVNGEYKELIDADKLDIANEKLMQYSFTTNNADIIINTLKKYKL